MKHNSNPTLSAAGTVKSITWTAAPAAGIAPDQFALFRVAVQLPTTDSVSFPATQTYGDGTVVRWDQATPPGGTEPEYPAPTLALTGVAEDEHHPSPSATPAPTNTAATSAAPADSTARWLAGGGIAIAVAALAFAFWSRRRT
jgi:hypothetical protein